MPRMTDEAIERNRVTSRARFHQNKPHNRKMQKAYRERTFRERPFIGWDGEGYSEWKLADNPRCLLDGEWVHHYMLFGASTGDCITGESLSTTDCLELMLKVERENPDAYHVGFAFEYDINMILKDLRWTHLAILRDCGKCRWADPHNNKRYRIEHVPHKWLRVSCEGVSATIYDTFGFFHTKYTVALKKYDIGSRTKRDRIIAGKDLRASFAYSDIEMVKAYWLDEISLLPPLMDAIRDAVYDGGYYISEWHGPGALAAYLLRDVGASKWHSKKIPTEVKSAIRYAYAGGRFTGCLCGLYLGPVYTADINSAYIYACSHLPRMDRGRWARQSPNDVDPRNLADFGLYRIEFDAGSERRDKAYSRGNPEPPYPLFHRAKNGILRWPRKCIGWYWSPEAKLVLGGANARVLEAWVFNGDASKPFQFVHDAYGRRVELQHQGNPAEKAYKWALAAMYGAFARRVGWNRQTRKAPPSHELAWAGYITSWCRATVYGPALAAWEDGKGRGLVSIDTDGITATVPFDPQHLSNGVGEGLGQWKLEEYTGILQWQNGIYWLRDNKGKWIEPKSRGIPKGSIPFAAALEALEKLDYKTRPFVHARLALSRTHFIGYGQALRGQFKRWRRWITQPVEVKMGGNAAGKAAHHYMMCYVCRKETGRNPASVEIASTMHTVSLMPEMPVNGKLPDINSHPHKLPWLEDQPFLPPGLMVSEFKYIVKDGDM
jgi:DNA polymerase type B, organellar and viral